MIVSSRSHSTGSGGALCSTAHLEEVRRSDLGLGDLCRASSVGCDFEDLKRMAIF